MFNVVLQNLVYENLFIYYFKAIFSYIKKSLILPH